MATFSSIVRICPHNMEACDNHFSSFQTALLE